jgi:ribonuclease J
MGERVAELTIYGGINEIGGNKILLEEKDRKLLLDFGFPYGRHKLYYEEYLKPRGGAGLLDPLTMGLLPPLKGIYRSDLDVPEVWQHFGNARPVEKLDGVLLTHAHMDHSAHISFIHESVPVYATALTAFIAKAIQDSGKSDFDQQVCYYNPVTRSCPTGWKQEAFLSGSGEKHQRKFHIAADDLKKLNNGAARFWYTGFWEKTGRQKEIISSPLDNHVNCRFELRCFPVDHSIPGACAWGINTGNGWVVYSGDLRLHGKRQALTRKFIEDARQLQPVALIIEGTNVNKETNITEQAVYENALKAISQAEKLVIADFSARDVDRLLTFLQVARQTGRKLAVLARDAYLLKTVRLLDPDMPDVAQDDNLVIYQETTASKSPGIWMRHLFAEYEGKTVLAEDVNRAQNEYILCFSFFDLNELPGIRPDPGGLYVYSTSEPHDEEQEIDMERLHNWLDRFGFKGFGLPIKVKDKYEIPEIERGLHASGHACGKDLLEIARSINPKVLIPVHSQSPGFYKEKLEGSGINVILPVEGQSLEL